MAGQMRHPHPGQDEKTGVVGQPRQMAAPRFRSPADEGVAGLALPGGRAKRQTGHRTTVALAHQVFEILTDTVAMTQVMIALKQKLKQPSLRAAGGHRRYAHGAQRLQLGVERVHGVGHFGGTVVALVIDRSSLARRQLQEPPGLEFEQERAAGHVFGPTGVVVPAPPGAEFAGKSRPMPRRMFNEQSPDLDQLFGPQAAALDDGFGRHPGPGYSKGGCESRTK